MKGTDSRGQVSLRPLYKIPFAVSEINLDNLPLNLDVTTKPCRPLIVPDSYDPSKTYCWSDKVKRPEFSAAPVSAFEHCPFPSSSDLLRYNVKMEVPNKDYAVKEEAFFAASCYWVATPIRVEGYKVLLRYEGFENDSSQDFWMNICTADVHPVTWCAKSGNILKPPKSLDVSTSDWADKLEKLLNGSYSLPDDYHETVKEHCKPVDLATRLETIDYRSNPNFVVPMVVSSSVSSRVNVVEWRGNSTNSAGATDDQVFQINCNMKSPFLYPLGWASYFEYPFRCSEGYSLPDKKYSGFTEDDENLFCSEIKLVRKSQRDYEDGRLSCFLSGMKVEAIDPLQPTEIRVGTIMKTLGNDYYIVRFDGTDIERCYHCSSAFVLPAGFAKAAGIVLSPPTGFESNFSWPGYLAATNSMAASHSIFSLEPNGEFQVGQWLEATNVMRNGEIFPALIVQISGRLLRIQFDGYSEENLHWFDSESPDIYPVGWCEMVGVRLRFPGNAPSERPVSHSA